MGDRRRGKEKLRPGDHLDRDRDAVDHRDRDRDRLRKRSRSPDHRRHHTGSPDRSPSADRSHRRHIHHHRRSPSPDPHRRKRRREGGEDDTDRDRDRERHRRRPPSEDADGSIKDKKKQAGSAPAPDAATENAAVEIDPDELEMMKKMGIPVGFDSTKGKPVTDNDWGAVRVVTKRQPRQYMNRRGGFNRPLPAEQNR